MSQETSTINPYSLLGLTPFSTLAEAKKSYYNWALLCHPDRGGKKEEMIVVKNAYDYIKKQLLFVETKEGNTYEKLEEEFQDFCKNQESKPPPFSAIYEETNDWINPPSSRFSTAGDQFQVRIRTIFKHNCSRRKWFGRSIFHTNPIKHKLRLIIQFN